MALNEQRPKRRAIEQLEPAAKVPTSCDRHRIHADADDPDLVRKEICKRKGMKTHKLIRAHLNTLNNSFGQEFCEKVKKDADGSRFASGGERQ